MNTHCGRTFLVHTSLNFCKWLWYYCNVPLLIVSEGSFYRWKGRHWWTEKQLQDNVVLYFVCTFFFLSTVPYSIYYLFFKHKYNLFELSSMKTFQTLIFFMVSAPLNAVTRTFQNNNANKETARPQTFVRDWTIKKLYCVGMWHFDLM